MYIHVLTMYMTCTYYSIVRTLHIHGSDTPVSIHVYARWVPGRIPDSDDWKPQQGCFKVTSTSTQVTGMITAFKFGRLRWTRRRIHWHTAVQVQVQVCQWGLIVPRCPRTAASIVKTPGPGRSLGSDHDMILRLDSEIP